MLNHDERLRWHSMIDTATSVTELLQALVRIPSVNPDGDPGTEFIGEKACAEYVAAFLQSSGAQVDLEEILPGRPNVIGRYPTDPSADGFQKPKIVFAPHTDTVGVVGMIVDPFGGELRDGKIWGRGASDTKGPMAAMLWAIHELHQTGELAKLPVEVHFAGFMSEETAQHGSRHFAEHHGADYAFAIIGEPTGLETVFKHKGCVWADIETFGRAVHGSRPELAENAIIRMAKLIKALDADFRPQLAEAGGEDPWLGKTTLSLGMIRGGSRPNITADHCVLTVDIRFTPLLHQQGGALPLLEAFVTEFDETAKVSPRMAPQPCLDTPEDHYFVQKLAAAGSKLVGAPWFCDAAFVAQAGVPSIAIGPGTIAQAHTIDEHIAVSDLEEGVEFFKNWLRTL